MRPGAAKRQPLMGIRRQVDGVLTILPAKLYDHIAICEGGWAEGAPVGYVIPL